MDAISRKFGELQKEKTKTSVLLYTVGSKFSISGIQDILNAELQAWLVACHSPRMGAAAPRRTRPFHSGRICC